jgi:hypothetical protein
MKTRKSAFPALLGLAVLCLSATGAFGLDAKVVRHSRDYGNLDMEIGLYWAQGYTPVGIEVVASGIDAGTWVLYAGDSWLDVKEWKVERYAGAAKLENEIENSAKTGWVPMDIAADEYGENAYVLYLKLEYGMTDWRLETAADEAGLKSIAAAAAAKGFLPVGFSSDGKGGFRALFVTLPGHGELKDWGLMDYDDRGTLSRQLPALMDGGWTLFGLLLHGGKAGVSVMK